MADPQSYRPSNIPTDPGVYRFYDATGTVIYVGKARNLKNRLNSYFGSNLTEKTYRMVHKAIRVDWTIVNTEVEALQLEFTWIKSYNPEFNVQFKDDKSYPYLAVAINEKFPKVYVSRQKKLKGTKYFGPFAHTWALRSTFDTLQKIYPVRSCSDGNFERAVKSKRQCLLGDIGKCSAPCVGWISEDDHKDLATKLVKYLDSNPADIEVQIEKEMAQASANEEFEKAGKLRDQLHAISKSNEIMGTSLSPNFTADVIGIHEETTHCAASLFSVRNGRIVGSRSWIIDMANVLEGEELIGATLSKIYLDNEIPKEILIDRESDEIAEFEAWLAQLSGHKVSIAHPIRGEKAEIIAVVKRNAHQSLIQYLSKRANDAAVSGAALEEIAQALDMPELPLRIECFDISNIQGKHMVASMVVFEDGQAKKSEYRRFAIDDESNFDDTRAMHHVLTRRLKRYLAEKDIDLNEIATTGGSRPKFAYAPQLIIVDGGQPQVAAAARALAELGIENITLVGLAKRLEEVWLPDNKDPVIFPRHSEALYLLQRVRDEAHRFAITFHRSKRSQVMLESLLDDIPSLGEVRRKALLDHFGSVTAIRSATLEQIATIPGIGTKTAQIIIDGISHEAATSPTVDMASGEILDK
jgi:excinuclease ABC subunit C